MTHAHDGHRKRLRERYLSSGASAFQDHELLELLLTYAIPRQDVNATAHALLRRFGSLERVFSAEPSALCDVDGIGESTAIFLRLQHDVQQRISLRRFSGKDGRVLLNTPAAAAFVAHEMLMGEVRETGLLLCLNAQLVLTAAQRFSSGTVDQAVIFPRVVAEHALLQHAHSVILVHNHPSGDPRPSKADETVTEAVSAALQSLGIRLNDHMIVGHGVVYSLTAGRILRLTGDACEVLTPEEYERSLKKQPPVFSFVMEEYQR